MSSNLPPRALSLALVPSALAMLATSAAAQPKAAEPREVRAVHAAAARVQADLTAFEAALSEARRGTDLSRCCARELDALAKSVARLASGARPVEGKLTRSKSRLVSNAGRELGTRVADLRAGVERLRKAGDRKSAGTAVGQLNAAQASLATLLPLLAELWATDEYAELVAPLNRCTELVRRVCGEENECADAPTCPMAKEMLGMYNDAATEEERYDLEGQCIIALDDHIIFAACAP